MERRKAITTAAAASLTLLAGAAGIALNSGIVGASRTPDVGNLSPVVTASDPAMVAGDGTAGWRTPTPTTVQPAPTFGATESVPFTTSGASAIDDDDHDDDDHDDDHDEGRYEGAEDDD